jgi:CubicO group peptidase (beta-lactamase class C family)
MPLSFVIASTAKQSSASRRRLDCLRPAVARNDDVLLGDRRFEQGNIRMSSFDKARLRNLKSVIEADVASGLYYGAVLKIVRGGAIGFDEAIGAADGPARIPLVKDSVFSIFSTTKAFTNILILRAIEHWAASRSPRASPISFPNSGGRRAIASPSSICSPTPPACRACGCRRPGMYLDRLDELLEAVIENVHGTVEPGQRCDYSPLANHVLMGEALRRTDPKGRRFRDILHEDLFAPLGMTSTSMGCAGDLKGRHVKPDMRGTVPIKHLSRTIEGDHALFEDPDVEAPHVGCASSVPISRASPRCCAAAASSTACASSRRAPSRWRARCGPARCPTSSIAPSRSADGLGAGAGLYGLGFNVRGTKIMNHQLGTLTRPRRSAITARAARSSGSIRRTGRQLRLPDRRRDDPGRQYRALPEALGHRRLGMRVTVKQARRTPSPMGRAGVRARRRSRRSTCRATLSLRDFYRSMATQTSSPSARAITALSPRPIARSRARRCSCWSATPGSAAGSSRAS